MVCKSPIAQILHFSARGALQSSLVKILLGVDVIQVRALVYPCHYNDVDMMLFSIKVLTLQGPKLSSRLL